jgi:hypothetical protein
VGASPRVEIYRVKPPSKGLSSRQAFDVNELLPLAKCEASGTIERFWGLGNAALVKRGGVWRAFPAVDPPLVIASEAKQSILSSCREMDCFASLAMTEKHTFAFSRRDAPEVMHVVCPLETKRAQGRPGARCTRDLMRNVHRKCAHEHTGPAESIRPSLRNGFTAYNELSPVNGSFATVIGGTYHQLAASTAASGPHVFAVRSRAVRYRHYQRPPLPVPRS